MLKQENNGGRYLGFINLGQIHQSLGEAKTNIEFQVKSVYNNLRLLRVCKFNPINFQKNDRIK